jgi:hypothetical protein
LKPLFDQDLGGRGFSLCSMDTHLKCKADVQIANVYDRLPDMVLQKIKYLTAKCGVIKYQGTHVTLRLKLH